MEIPRRTFLFAIAPIVVIGCSTPMQTSSATIGDTPATDSRTRARGFPRVALADIPERTSITITRTSSGTTYGTTNQDESRPALSLTKLLLADYVLRFGDGSAEDRDRCERMVRTSDNLAADEIDDKYPMAIDAIAQEFELPGTARGGYWGDSVTSTLDVVRFLELTKRRDRGSAILTWMATASPVMAEGVPQDFGTVHVRNATGTKWGISNDHTIAASASYGCDFSVAAMTFGSTEDNTADVLVAFPATGCRAHGVPTAK